ncbi:hypothetical protein ACLESO_17150 [Pyxidicoccus sp. 3LG]
MSNNPDKFDTGRHGDAFQLAREHERQKRKSCFWKHPVRSPGGRQATSATGIVIGQGEYDTHLCRYEKNGLDKAEASDDVYNLRNGKTNRQRAQDLGYLDANGRSQETPGFRSALAQVVRSKRANPRSTVNKLRDFIAAYRGRYGQSLRWLELDPKGWDVKHTIKPSGLVDTEYRDLFRRVFNRSKTNKPSDQRWRFDGFRGKTGGSLPENFALYYSDTSPGLGQWFPYEHDYHHLLPAGTFQEEVVGKDAGNGITYMERASVVMKSHWNIHSRDNIMMLPSEESPAHILDLPAHLPWQMGADHTGYSATLVSRLERVRKVIDQALTAPAANAEERHKLVNEAAASIKDMLEKLSQKARQNLLDAGFHTIS